MVNVKNYNIVGVGDSIQGTLNKYLEGLTNTNISLEGASSEEVLEGEIERLGMVVKDGTSIYDLKLKGNDNIFSVSTETSREVALTSVGDKVRLKYIKVGEGRFVLTNSFENLTIKLVEESEIEKKPEVAGE